MKPRPSLDLIEIFTPTEEGPEQGGSVTYRPEVIPGLQERTAEEIEKERIDNRNRIAIIMEIIKNGTPKPSRKEELPN